MNPALKDTEIFICGIAFGWVAALIVVTIVGGIL